MLFLSRKPGQSISITPRKELGRQLTLERVFGEGPIFITVKQILRGEVKLGIHAHSHLAILREEVAYQPLSDSHNFRQHQVRQPSGNPVRLILASNVRYHRQRCQLSVARLSELSGLSQTTLFAIEQGLGEINVDALDSLAAVFGVSIAELLRET